jgi:hypothetical protein
LYLLLFIYDQLCFVKGCVNLEELKLFIKDIKSFKPTQEVFNPWNEYNIEYDINSKAVETRIKHLEEFLKLRFGKARMILIAEAVGYQGGRFSGIPLVSERLLLGHNKDIYPSIFIKSEEGKRTSNPDCKYFKHKTQSSHGFCEPTATIIWDTVLRNNVSPYEIATWNTFPFHPFNKSKGLLSNRTPREEEIREGQELLVKFIKLFPEAETIAVGRIAQRTLKSMGIECLHVPHPSNGGANDFREAFKEVATKIYND